MIKIVYLYRYSPNKIQYNIFDVEIMYIILNLNDIYYNIDVHIKIAFDNIDYILYYIL